MPAIATILIRADMSRRDVTETQKYSDGAAFAQGFAPVCSDTARILILGSFPGRLSLETNQYYAHPRNCFWTIMGSLFGFDGQIPYPERVALLRNNGVALWDVLQGCTRVGSLDSAIKAESVIINDFNSFFAVHRRIGAVFFNGARAETEFKRHVRDTLSQLSSVHYLGRLPSTSPAMASLSVAEKTHAWRDICNYL